MRSAHREGIAEVRSLRIAAANRGRSLTAFADDAFRTRAAFKNWLAVGAVAGVVLPSRIPPRHGSPRLMERRMAFRTRLGPVLETEIGNAWPIVKIFRNWHFDLPIDWSTIRGVVEIGGHVGAFAIWAALRAPHAQIVTFEPEPRNFRDLEHNVDRSGLADRIVAINAAVAAENGRRALDVPTQRNRASIVAQPTARADATEVECVGLEGYFQRKSGSQADVLKLDCEGAEWEILPSLRHETLSRFRHILVGCHAREQLELDEMQELLAREGFSLRVVETGSDPEYRFLAPFWAERT